MAKKLWIGLVVVALLGLTVTAFAADPDPGDSGTPFQNWWTKSDQFTWTAYWEVGTGWVHPVNGDPELPLKIECDIEMYVTQTGWTTLHFHIGHNTTEMVGELPGGLSGNHPCTVGICNVKWVKADGDPDGQATELRVDRGPPDTVLYEREGEILDPIPVEFEFALEGGTPVACSWEGPELAGGWGWWSPEYIPAVSDYKFIVTITPQAGQGNGTYRLDPVWAVAPAM